MVQFYDPIEKKELDYALDRNLKVKWDRFKDGKLIKHDSDRVYIVDGRERVGKSLFTLQQAKYIDPYFNLSRVCFTPDEFLHQIRTAPQGAVVVFDEAFRGLSSKSSQSKVNKRIVQALMEMGQRNLVVFIVLPTIFLLELYPAVLRSECLFHIYKEKNSSKRCFKVYNYRKKSQLYMTGKKKGFSYSFPKTKMHGRFYGKYPIDEESYRAKKLKALRESEIIKSTEKEEEDSKWKKYFMKMEKGVYSEFINSFKPLQEWMKKYGIERDFGTIAADIRKLNEEKDGKSE